MILGLVFNLLLCVCYCEFVCKFVLLGGCHGNLSMLQLFCLLEFCGKIYIWNGGLLSGDRLQLCDNFIKIAETVRMFGNLIKNLKRG